jgi:hypothetical protein
VGRIADALLKRGRLDGRIWLGVGGYLLSVPAFVPAFLTHQWIVALPLFTLGAFVLAGTGPPLDAVRIDVVVPRLRGRAESIREVLRTAVEGGAPALIGVLAGHLARTEAAGLQRAFLITLLAVLVNGLVLLLAVRSYPPDVAAALASSEKKQMG